MVRPVATPHPDQEHTVNAHVKTFLTVAVCMAIINRISFIKALTSEANANII